MRLVARLAFALCVMLVTGELALQLASLTARSVSPRGKLGIVRQDAGQGAEPITILCVGDSHTFGLPLPPEDSYPAQLERALEERHPGQDFRVVNLGIPGVNSGFVANRLERQLMQLRPSLLIVWVGINNRWNVVESRAEVGEGSWPKLRRGLFRSRLFRLASIAWYTRTGHQYDPSDYGGWHEGEVAPSGRWADPPPGVDLAPGLSDDLRRMAETAAALDTPAFFVNYPMRKQRPLNRLIEQAAFEAGVMLMDSNREFESAVRRGEAIGDLIDLRAGPHPSRRLYGYVVAAALSDVERAVFRRGRGTGTPSAGVSRAGERAGPASPLTP